MIKKRQKLTDEHTSVFGGMSVRIANTKSPFGAIKVVCLDSRNRAAVGVNKDSYLILDTLPVEYDSRVKVYFIRLSRRRRTYGERSGYVELKISSVRVFLFVFLCSCSALWWPIARTRLKIAPRDLPYLQNNP